MRKIILLSLITSAVPSFGMTHEVVFKHNHDITLTTDMLAALLFVPAALFLSFKLFKNLSRLIMMLAPMILLLTPSKAIAHHPMDGTIPSNFLEGMLSGLGHPIIELDHFIFLIIVALFATISRSLITLPLAFVAFSMVGTLIHLMGLYVDPLETIIISSITIGGSLLILSNVTNIPSKLYKALFFASAPLFGLFHGYAYAEAIIGAENTPLFAYLLGLAIIQFSLVSLSAWLLNKLENKRMVAIKNISYFFGAIAIGVTLPYLHDNILSYILPAL